jgi:hypothetical protein
VPQPPGNGGDIDAGFNAAGGEPVAEVVLGDPGHSNDHGGPAHRFLALGLKLILARQLIFFACRFSPNLAMI